MRSSDKPSGYITRKGITTHFTCLQFRPCIQLITKEVINKVVNPFMLRKSVDWFLYDNSLHHDRDNNKL